MKSVEPPSRSSMPSPSATRDAGRPGGNEPPELPEWELTAMESAFLQFGGADAFYRPLLRQEFAEALKRYLEDGYVRDDAGPIRREVETAWHAEGVEAGRINLALHSNARVFGFLDCQGVGDTWYVYAPGQGGLEYFAVTVESGMGSTATYDIFVSPAMDWEEFKRQLPPA